jgi:hypothetical protein
MNSDLNGLKDMEMGVAHHDLGSEREVILEIGGEGGSIALLRERDTDGNWTFMMFTNEVIFEDELGKNASTGTRTADTFSEAVSLLDHYPWPELHPLTLHPRYAERVLQIVRERAGALAEARWREALDR